MNRKRTIFVGTLSALALLIVVLDSKTALSGAAIGIELCIKTVIPALFPFLFLTGIITKTLSGTLNKAFSPLGKLCGIPKGTELNIVLGLLGGYPIGAQAVYNGYRSGYYSKENAKRMLSFCNNPGPAFIFGMIGCLFDSIVVPWVIWLIILLCVFTTALIQPPYNIKTCHSIPAKTSGSLEVAIKAMAKICGWVIIFRTYIAVLQRWVLWLLPAQINILVIGFLELANGCASMLDSQNVVFRFSSICAMLSFGGCCVTMQTMGIAGSLIDKQYFIAKLFQMFLSVPLSLIAATILFSQPITIQAIVIAAICFCLAVLTCYFLRKNNSGNHLKNNI